MIPLLVTLDVGVRFGCYDPQQIAKISSDDELLIYHNAYRL